MDCQMVETIIVGWLKDYLVKSKQKGFVIGISGGVDSALVSTLCAKTGYPTMLISMPINQAEDQLTRANNHMKDLRKYSNVFDITHDLTKTFDLASSEFMFIIKEDALTMANLKSRIRMNTLYAYAGHNNFLVAGTGNKVEDYGIGFFTKYGDGGVDISPIGDLTKTEVWELSKYLGVNDEIVNAKPTDGLWADNRGDEDAIGATYAELEKAMKFCDDFNIHSAEDYGNKIGRINTSDRERQVVLIYLNRHIGNAHKMSMPPICYLI